MFTRSHDLVNTSARLHDLTRTELSILMHLFHAFTVRASGECVGNFDTRYPYLVSIRQPGRRSHVCTGTLIRENFVLTAAHCVDPDSVYSAGRLPIVHIGQQSVDEVDDNVEVPSTPEIIDLDSRLLLSNSSG